MRPGGDAELAALRRPFRIGVLAVVAAIIAIGGVIAAFGSNADRPAGVAERWLVALSDTTREGVHDDALDRMAEHQAAEPLVPDLADPAAAVALVPALRDDHGAADDGKARFDTIRVGRGVEDGVGEATMLVPVEVTPYDSSDPVDGYVVMRDGDDGWKVAGFGSPASIEELGAFTDLCPGGPEGSPAAGASAGSDGTVDTVDGSDGSGGDGGTAGASAGSDGRCAGFPIRRPASAPVGFWFGAIGLGVLITIGVSAAIRAAGPPPARDRRLAGSTSRGAVSSSSSSS